MGNENYERRISREAIIIDNDNVSVKVALFMGSQVVLGRNAEINGRGSNRVYVDVADQPVDGIAYNPFISREVGYVDFESHRGFVYFPRTVRNSLIGILKKKSMGQFVDNNGDLHEITDEGLPIAKGVVIKIIGETYDDETDTHLPAEYIYLSYNDSNHIDVARGSDPKVLRNIARKTSTGINSSRYD